MSRLWHEGTIGIPKEGHNRIAHYWVKSYARKSQYGIEGGKISKLLIRIGGDTVADYDRGWGESILGQRDFSAGLPKGCDGIVP